MGVVSIEKKSSRFVVVDTFVSERMSSIQIRGQLDRFQRVLRRLGEPARLHEHDHDRGPGGQHRVRAIRVAILQSQFFDPFLLLLFQQPVIQKTSRRFVQMAFLSRKKTYLGVNYFASCCVFK